MNIEDLRTYCLSKAKSSEDFPFDDSILVFKVAGKMFALTSVSKEEFTVNLKCDPEYALELREQHSEIIPGYHMSKKHWNTVSFEGGLARKMLLSLIDHSYDLVVQKLPASIRKEIELEKG